MTQSINKYDFSQAPDPKGLAEFNAKKAINNAFKDAPVVAKAKQGLVPTPKAAKTSPAKKKAGRVVGISADENAFLKKALQLIANSDAMLQTFVEAGKFEEAFDKLQARYNK